jgi:hypothetical protein
MLVSFVLGAVEQAALVVMASGVVSDRRMLDGEHFRG